MAPDLRAHCQRTFESAERVGLGVPLTVDDMVDLCVQGIHRFPADADLYIRPLVFGTEGLLVPTDSGFALTSLLDPLDFASSVSEPATRGLLHS